ncbi:hypothetical protein XA68_12310 [Ophiocordyceps unilateralis]|uniref:Aspartate-semialdehyde dehydrogenase n=1 Tax=Ophiocordyceps unilateralis TaxID=268505 RepID=A0A2A9PEW0_OPHUN|nr:hypothetical protein XA68_12310 [Ophiocordyceps unilateralis]
MRQVVPTKSPPLPPKKESDQKKDAAKLIISLSPPSSLKIGVLGCTGSVGQRFVLLLAQHPFLRLHAVGASSRSEGKRYREAVRWKQDRPMGDHVGDMVVRACRAVEFADCDVVFSGLDSDVAGDIGASASRNSSRPTSPSSPMPKTIVKTRSVRSLSRGLLVCNSNCAVIGLVLPLAGLQSAFGPITSVSVVTLQALSGAGYPGVPAADLVDNVVPFIQGEEDKLESEARKILGQLDHERVAILHQLSLRVSATCNRVPVQDGHTACVSLSFQRRPPPDAAACRDALRRYVADVQTLGCPSAPVPPIFVLDEQDRPQPRLDRHLGNGYAVSVGRLRADESGVFDIKFTALSHNTIIGAAGSSILNAEAAVLKGYI